MSELEYENLDARLLDLDELSDAHLEVGKEVVNAYGGTIYPMDILANGALNRSIAQIAGFGTLLRERNFICAGAILRLQLDTALRFYAAFLVDDPHKFAHQVLAGAQIRKLRDRSGKRMYDGYLVSKLSEEYDWIPRVYERTSGYIHLSAIHIMSAISIPEGEDGAIEMKISAKDKELPEHLYLEAVEAFMAATEVFLDYVRGWVYTKNNPHIAQKLRQQQDDA